MTVGLLYMPALHEGVIQLLKRWRKAGVDAVYILGDRLTSEVHGVPRDFPVSSEIMADCVNLMEIFTNPCVAVEADNLESALLGKRVFAHRHQVVVEVLQQARMPEPDVWSDDFLRWDLPAAMKSVPVHDAITVTEETFFQDVICLASEEATRGENFFRQVGAVLVRSGEVLLAAHNQSGHFQGEHLTFGNPRVWIDGGHADLNPDLHAEQALIVAALNGGISFREADVVVTCFPCRTCANMLAKTGLRRLFFKEGYSQHGTDRVLIDHSVELYQVHVK